MFAVVILAMAMIPMATMMGVGARQTVKDFRTIEAIQLLGRVTNLLLQEPYANLPVNQTTPTSAYPANPGIPLGTAVPGKETTYRSDFTCVEITPIHFRASMINVSGAGFNEGNPQPGDFSAPVELAFANCVKRIEVRVSWREPNGVNRQIDAVTFRANLARR